MQLGFIGLGKMGNNMVQNILDHKHQVVVFDRDPKAIQKMKRKGANDSNSLSDLVAQLPKQKIIWMMIPAGKPVDETLEKLIPLLNKNDIIIDGGNSFYEDTMKRAKTLKSKGIQYMDVGTSGGIDGARHGACMMIGGPTPVFKKLSTLFKDMCVKNGSAHVGKSGMGHFVKMVHNGIEYGMMQAIAEGFDVMDKSTFKLDFEQIANVWKHGSIIDSHLIDWTQEAFAKYGNKLANISGEVASSGEGLWTVETAEKLKVAVPVIKSSLLARYRSKKHKNQLGNKLLSALRDLFGGHGFKKK